MFRSTVIFYCALVALAAVARSQQPKTVTVSSAPSCPKCEIRLDTVVTLVEDSVLGGVSAGMWLEPDRQGRWYSLERKPFRFIIFDRSGKPIKTFGREGEGPWEYQFPYHPRVLADTIYIQDNSLGRLTLLTLDAKPIRMVTIGHHSGSVELLGDGSMFVMPALEVGPGPSTPIDRLDRSGKLVRRIAIDTVVRKGRYFTSRFSSRSGADVWVGSMNRYRLDRWDTGGKLVSTLIRDADWFQDYDLAGTRKPLEALPLPSLTAAWEDDRGLLWTLIRVADEKWDANAKLIRANRSKFLMTVQSGEGSGEVLSMEANQMLYDTILEVIDIKTGRLVASRRFDSVFWNIIRGGYLAGYRESDEGIPSVPIMKLRLEGYRK